MSEPVVVRINVAHAMDHVYKGIRQQLIAQELRTGGIPAEYGPSGIHVKTGTLDVHEEDGLRVFTWLPPGTAKEQHDTQQEALDARQDTLDEEQEELDNDAPKKKAVTKRK